MNADAFTQDLLRRLGDLERDARVVRLGGGGGSGNRNRPFSVVSINATTGAVSVRGGMIIHGTKRILVPDATVAIAGGTEAAPTEAGIQYDYAAGSAAWVAATLAAGDLTPTPTVWMQPMFTAYRAAGRAIIKDVLWDSIVILPGVFAPGS